MICLSCALPADMAPFPSRHRDGSALCTLVRWLEKPSALLLTAQTQQVQCW